MFIQIHMLVSMPPGNLNRDDTGQPKKCIFGGVTRGRVSSQCIKRNIRLSEEFAQTYGDALACRSLYLPKMIEEAALDAQLDIPTEELGAVKAAIAAKFRKEKAANRDTEESEDDQAEAEAAGDPTDKTGQLVFFPPIFARKIAEHIAAFRKEKPRAYDHLLDRVSPKPKKTEKDKLNKELLPLFQAIEEESKANTVDIGLFGRMTTSDLVINVEAACQVAHAIGTHETIIESDYFTAMDDRKSVYGTTQTDRAGAAFLGSGETETFFNASVYYKYLNVDLRALRNNVPGLGEEGAAVAAGVLLRAAVLSSPTGKQNNFASHGISEFILVEASETRRPISYANAFLRAVDSGLARNLMADSAVELQNYIDSVAPAYSPADTKRLVLAIGSAPLILTLPHERSDTLKALSGALVAYAAGEKHMEQAS